jgi:hypothetical protein
MPARRLFHAALAAAVFYVGVQISPAPYAAPDDWRSEASSADAERLARIDEAWQLALGQSRRGGHRPELSALGDLVSRDAALAGPQPEAGAYHCRTVKLGNPDAGGPTFAAYGWFRCEVEEAPGGELILHKTTGSQRPWGKLYRDSKWRHVYVGAVSWGGEEDQQVYGRDPERDQIGAFERLGPGHYRLVIPWSRQESVLDLIELKAMAAPSA